AGKYRYSARKTKKPVQVDVSGGTYIDEATGEEIALDRDLMTLLEEMPENETEIPITPLTTIAAELAMNADGGATVDNIRQAFNNVNAWMGGAFDIATTIPRDLNDGDALATDAENDYALALAGFSQLAADLELDPDEFLDKAIADASDGLLDGKRDDEDVFVNPATLTAELAGAVIAFVESDKNPHAVQPVFDVVEKIGGFSDDLKPTKLPPIITLISPTSGKLSGGTAVTITGGRFLAGFDYSVTFDGVAASNVTRIDSTMITCITPAGEEEGAVDVTISGPNGSATLEDGFTYTIPRWGTMIWGTDDWTNKDE
ncbi:MAG: IPT/TIG domain-containing protein, partial [Planctomycetaceae bacterium]|nr:IPT/TIG domain-containing protein [Planctomycetaceae bacterium]